MRIRGKVGDRYGVTETVKKVWAIAVDLPLIEVYKIIRNARL